jgi:hypothetical protein
MARKKPPQYPIGTVALYGPDDIRTTKIAAAVNVELVCRILGRWIHPVFADAQQDFLGQRAIAARPSRSAEAHDCDDTYLYVHVDQKGLVVAAVIGGH